MRVIVLFFAIAGALGAAGLSLAGAVSVRADIFNIVWPIPLGAGAVTLAILFAVRSPRWRVARGLALICAAGLILTATPWRMLAPPGQDGAADLVVTSFNAWVSNTSPDAAEAMLRRTRADIIALQEVRGRAGDMPARLADAYPFAAVCPWGAALISRHPFEDTGCSNLLPAAWGRIRKDGRAVTVASIHLARPSAASWYRGHAAALDALTEALETPLVLAGDFNTGEGGFLMAELERDLAPLTRITHGLRTWPSGRHSPTPLLGIDHVWLSEGLAPASVTVGPHAGSDHRSVTAGVIFEQSD